MKKFWSLVCIISGFNSTIAQSKKDALLQKILFQNNNPAFRKILQDKDTYRLQIIYTVIDRDINNTPSFKNYSFNTDSDYYFYPASTVKLPLALLTLEKINELRATGINKHTPVQFDSSQPWQIPVLKDSTSETGLPTLAHYIKKAFLVSDNDAYNRMYQFAGQKDIHKKLWNKGYTGIRLPRQFMGLPLEKNRYTNPVRFTDPLGNIIYSQPAEYNTEPFDFSVPVSAGKGYINSADSLINMPMEFTTSNVIPLPDLQRILQSVLFPGSVPPNQRFNLTADDRAFLLRYLSQYASETEHPRYDNTEYNDSYVKYFFKDSTGAIPSSVRVYNKVGWAYGFLTDVSYVADFKNKVEYMLTATVYANRDGILNDDKYDYETVGLPFLYELGQTIYAYELQRKRKHIPDLKEFKMKYKKRSAKVGYPEIKNVDN